MLDVGNQGRAASIFVIAGFVDNVLKPIFLGRGVDAPMPIVLIGALGGMISAGLIGLFIGATFLSLAYCYFYGMG